MAERCEGCGKPFDGRSKPRWAFTREAKPLGLMHTGCAVRANPHRWGSLASQTTEREAQFIAWTDLVDSGALDSARELAITMAWAEHPSLDQRFLSENQRHWLEGWHPADQQDAIKAAYRELLAEFDEWERTRD